MQPPQVILAGSGELTSRVADFLASRDELAAVLLPADCEPLTCLHKAPRTLQWPAESKSLDGVEFSYLLSVAFPHRFPTDWLTLPRLEALNLHLGFVPYNRGADAWRWPLLDGSPAGFSLHVMDEGSDAGPYVFRHRVAVSPVDTAASLKQRLERGAYTRFISCWPHVADLLRLPQPAGGSVHRRQDVRDLQTLTASDMAVIRRLRAATNDDGVVVADAGVRIRLSLTMDDTTDHQHPTN